MRDARADGKSDILATDAVVSASRIHRHRFSPINRKLRRKLLLESGNQETRNRFESAQQVADLPWRETGSFFRGNAGSSFLNSKDLGFVVSRF
jgi:hypothetical protein